jgi:MtN3 and saliva related transmembrane protein
VKINVPIEIIGWASTAILLATICRQVYSQWKSKATAGVSRWLFIGQISASIGFAVYSYQLHNWVFLFSNAAMIVAATVGEVIYISNRKPPVRAIPVCLIGPPATIPITVPGSEHIRNMGGD